jgi:hypothetical protein
MAKHDSRYKWLFGHREMVADLLTGFVPEPWVKEVELESAAGSRLTGN